MGRKKKPDTITKWFDPYFSNQLFIPSTPDFQQTTINRHVSIQSYQHPDKGDLDIWFVEKREKQKPVKNYHKSIQTIQSKLQNASDPKDIKKYQTSLKTAQTKLAKQNENAGKVLKCLTVGIPLDQTQHQIVSAWYAECIKVYNKCVEIQSAATEFFSFEELRAEVFSQLYGNSDKPAPYETLGDEVRSFISNRKSCLTSLKRKVITHFTQKQRSLKNNQSLMIPGKAITTLGLFKRNLGSIHDWKEIYQTIQNVTNNTRICDSRLIYDSVLKRYTLNIPYYVKKDIQPDKKPVVALDPGERIFMSFYSPEQSGFIGNNIRFKILEEERKIRRLERVLKHKVNKQKEKLRNPKSVKRHIQIKYNNIRNIVDELHHQTAKYLTDHYQHIYIPKFETQKMVRNYRKQKKQVTNSDIDSYKRHQTLNKRVKFVLNSLSHYRFRQHLQNKCLEKGCKMEIVNESYTSITCGGCGKQSKQYKDRRKICSCGCEIDRDLNGSRNILMRSLKLN